ncbi:MBOAT family O-acyltransferase [Intestinibacter sp.]|uniref:MBOAT family O-acyltransferase n=1 Tax=Intestinibacter sp. TaxID=1965304 RepID=UPI003F150690
MVFSDLLFVFAFLPVNIIFYFLSKNLKVKNIVLIVFSLLFYAWGEPLWISILIFSTLVDYVHALAIEKSDDPKKRKLLLINSIVINLILLGVFKYAGFFVSNINYIFKLSLAVPKISLPIGISFYTFQTISYTADVYCGRVKAQKSFAKFLMYVSLYPQLIAGPIVRYVDIEKEIENRDISIVNISEGINRFIIGLAKKVVIANTAASLVATFLDSDLATIGVLDAWFGIFMYTIQIYFDFSGYSDMAIGLGRIFGFHYCENFNYPYISKSATEFWRRWHISLGSFFRDYVYIPLGGNRKRQLLNIFIVWFLTGFWHGASWNFIIWGLYFGAIIYFEKKVIFSFAEKIPNIIKWVFTIIIIMVGWGIFYYTDLNKLGLFLKALVGLNNNLLCSDTLSIIVMNNIIFIVIAVIASTPLVSKLFNKINTNQNLDYLRIVVNVCLIFCVIAMLVGEGYNPFLYYRF